MTIVSPVEQVRELRVYIFAHGPQNMCPQKRRLRFDGHSPPEYPWSSRFPNLMFDKFLSSAITKFTPQDTSSRSPHHYGIAKGAHARGCFYLSKTDEV